MSNDRDDEQIIFAQVDADLDSHPKIRKAGSFGRQVFEFILRRNARRGFKGSVPISHVDADYLAEQLMIDPRDAVTGVTKAVTARLIELDHHEGVVRIVGWHASWGKRAKEGKERTADWRKRKNAKDQDSVTLGDAGDETPSQVTTGDECDAREEKRREERSREHTRARERHPRAGGIARNVWTHAVTVRSQLTAANIQVPPWAITVGTEHSGWVALLDRVCELLVDSTPEQAEKVCRNRVDVAVAKARADGDGNYFVSTTMFHRNSFDTWAHLDPASIGRKRAGPKRAEGALIGAASPRTDHPESDRLIPINEL